MLSRMHCASVLVCVCHVAWSLIVDGGGLCFFFFILVVILLKWSFEVFNKMTDVVTAHGLFLFQQYGRGLTEHTIIQSDKCQWLLLCHLRCCNCVFSFVFHSFVCWPHVWLIYNKMKFNSFFDDQLWRQCFVNIWMKPMQIKGLLFCWLETYILYFLLPPFQCDWLSINCWTIIVFFHITNYSFCIELF